MKAMVLAAGRGRRLGALTRHRPKPLLEVGGEALLHRHLRRLAAAGVTEAVINLSWHGARIRASVGDGAAFGLRAVYSDEGPVPLETAGGIVQALPQLGDAPFLAVSADVLCDHPLSLSPLRGDDLGRLLMVPNPPHHPDGDFALVDGRLAAGGAPRLTFSGIALLHPAMFTGLAPGVRPLRPLLEAAIAAGRLAGDLHPGYWSDCGTVARLAAARRRFAGA